MSNVENRIVVMTFDNERFERNIAETLNSLDNINKSIQLLGAAEGISDISKAVGEFNGESMVSAVEKISNRFGALGAIGLTVIQDLTRDAIAFSKVAINSVLNPISAGGMTRATNIEQAMFMFRGLGMDIEAAMESATIAVTGTAYGLDVAAKAAAQLGGSGLQAGEEMTRALRGISGIAAMTNSSYEEMASIFIAAAGNGRVMSNELGRISYRGVNAAAALANVWNTTEAEVRRMATAGEISFEMFYQAMDDAFGEHATKANETYTGSLSNMRAALSRLGAVYYTPKLEQQRDLFNSLSPAIDKVKTSLVPLINTYTDLRRVAIDGIRSALDGFETTNNLDLAVPNFSKGLINVFEALQNVTGAVKEAFRDIFPPGEVSWIVKVSEVFLNLSERIKMGGDSLNSVKDIFRGAFSVIAIGLEIVKQTGRFVIDLLSSLVEAMGFDGGGILRFFGNLGGSLADLKKNLVDAGGIEKIFDALRNFIDAPIETLGTVLKGLGSAFEFLKDRMSGVGSIFSGIKRVIEALLPILASGWDLIKEWASELGNNIADALSDGDFQTALDVINVGLLGGIAALLTKFVRSGFGLKNIGSGGILGSITNSLDALTGTLKTMTLEIKANVLLKIAGALAILTAAIVALSFIDSASLTKSLTAISVGFAQLVIVLTAIEKTTTTAGAAKYALIAGALMGVAAAMVIFAAAVKIMATLSWNELAIGLTGVITLLGALTIALNLMPDASGLLRIGVAMTGIAAALLILSFAVRSFAKLSWEELGRGLAGIAGGLAVLSIGMRAIPKGMTTQGVGILAVATSLLVLQKAVKSFSNLSWQEMGKGLAGVAGALVTLGIAMRLMPDGMMLQSISLVIISSALSILSRVIKDLGGQDTGTLVTGIAAIAGILGVLSIALIALQSNLGGAASLVVVAVGLMAISSAVKTLGELDTSTIITGLLTMAGVFAVLGLAGLVLGPLVPVILGLGAAMLLFGAGLALFGTGMTFIAGSIMALSKAGEIGFKSFLAVITLFIKAIPNLISELVLSLAKSMPDILAIIPMILEVGVAIILALLDGIKRVAPELATTIIEVGKNLLIVLRDLGPDLIETGLFLGLTLLQGLYENTPEFAAVGINIIIALVDALTSNIGVIADAALRLVTAIVDAIISRMGDIIELGIRLITEFISGIASKIGDVVSSGLEILEALLSGILDSITTVVDAAILIITTILKTLADKAVDLVSAGVDVLVAILKGIGDNLNKVVTAAADVVIEFIKTIGNKASDLVTAGADALVKFLDGVAENIYKVAESAADVIIAFVDAVASNTHRVIESAADIIIEFINSVADTIRSKSGELREAGKNIAGAILDGATFGLASKAGDFANSAVNVVKGGVSAIGGFLGINSPSRLFMKIGEDTIAGAVVAFDRDTTLRRSMVNNATKSVDAFNEIISRLPEELHALESEFEPRITPILDLSNVEKASLGIEGVLSTGKISVGVGLANDILTTTEQVHSGKSESETKEPTEIKFEQNIYSPRELSVSQIYKNTRSQIALAKEELNIR